MANVLLREFNFQGGKLIPTLPVHFKASAKENEGQELQALIETKRTKIIPISFLAALHVFNLCAADHCALPEFILPQMDELSKFSQKAKFIHSNYEEHAESLFLGIQNKKDHKIIGTMIYREDKQNRPRLPYFILPRYQRQGFAAEAYQAVDHFFTAHFGKPTLYAQAHKDNQASIGFLTSMGFKQEGIVLYRDKDYEGHQDHIRMVKGALSPSNPLII